jgi:TolB-like protein/tetratricopeptide (TPR) repeat protein
MNSSEGAFVADHEAEEIAFGPFRLDTCRRTLTQSGTAIPLGSRSFDILCVLAGLRGNVVTKDQLMERVWPGLVVEENTIHVHLSALRKALGEGQGGQRYIVTVPGQGYRLIGGVPEASCPPVPEKPSIAVLPFQNLGGGLEDYFADGVVEEIITALTRFPALFVVARNSSFAYKHRSVDVRQIGRELGVRYVLEGSARQSKDRLRITGQLIEAATGAHLWADRFEGRLSDVFDLQDELTTSVVGAVGPKLQSAEIERAKRKPTGSLQSYDYYLRGLSHFHRDERRANAEALRLFYKAIELDPEFAAAHGFAAWSYCQRLRGGWIVDLSQERAETKRLVDRAVELGREDAVALCSAGVSLAMVVGDVAAGITLIDRARELNPNLAIAWSCSSWARNWYGHSEVAIEHAMRAMRLSPMDPLSHMMEGAIGFGHLMAGRYDAAIFWAGLALSKHAGFLAAHRILAVSLALSGQIEQARRAMARMRDLNPTMRLADVKDIAPLCQPEHAKRYAEGLRMAGLPD